MRSPSVLALACLVLSAVFAHDARADEATAPTAPTTGGGMQSPAAFAAGVFLSSAGTAGLIAGAYLFTSVDDACAGLDRGSIPSQSQVDACRGEVNSQIGGVVSMVTGGAFLLAGIPVLALGASPSDDAPTATVALGPTRATLVVSF